MYKARLSCIKSVSFFMVLFGFGCIKAKTNAGSESLVLADTETGSETLVLVEPVPIYQNPKDPLSTVLWTGHCYLVSHIDGQEVLKKKREFREKIEILEPQFNLKLKQYFESKNSIESSPESGEMYQILNDIQTYETLYRHLPSLSSPLPEGSNFPVNPIAMNLFSRTFFKKTSGDLVDSRAEISVLNHHMRIAKAERAEIMEVLIASLIAVSVTPLLPMVGVPMAANAMGFLLGSVSGLSSIVGSFRAAQKQKSIGAEIKKSNELHKPQAAAGAAFVVSLKDGMSSEKFFKSIASQQEISGAREQFKNILLSFFKEAKSENIILKIGETFQDDISLSARIQLLADRSRSGEIDYFTSENCPRDSAESMTLKSLLN